MTIEECYITLVEEEGGNVVSLDQKLVETGVDSFGVMMILTNLDDQFQFLLEEEKVEMLDIPNLTFNDIKDRHNVCKQLLL